MLYPFFFAPFLPVPSLQLPSFFFDFKDLSLPLSLIPSLSSSYLSHAANCRESHEFYPNSPPLYDFIKNTSNGEIEAYALSISPFTHSAFILSKIYLIPVSKN